MNTNKDNHLHLPCGFENSEIDMCMSSKHLGQNLHLAKRVFLAIK